MNRMMALCLALLPGCGTHSVIRPADNLAAGELEIMGGAAFNSLSETTFVAEASVGVTDWLEIGGQYETYSGAGWIRFGPLNTDDHGFALALSIGGGYVSLLNSNMDLDQEAAAMAGLTIGRRFGVVEPYLGYRGFYLPAWKTSLNAFKGGLRFTWGVFCIGVEGGATLHHGVMWIGEGTAAVGFRFGG